MKEITAAIITIGDELLIGQTIDTNSAFIGQELNSLGIWLQRRIAIGDDKKDIILALEQESAHADVVIITGGLGPTNDDITKDVLCDYFESNLVLDEKVLENVKKRAATFGFELLQRNKDQALVPDNCQPLYNAVGSAPGMWFEKEQTIYISMPGVPHEMKEMMQKQISPLLSDYFELPVILHRSLLSTGMPESLIAEKLKGFENSLPDHIKLAYLPGNGTLKLRLTARGVVMQRVAHELDQYFESMVELIPEIIIATEDISLAEIVGEKLKKHGLTVATAESCTGGYVSHLFTKIAGSSAFYKGSIVSYTNSLKTRLLDVPEDILSEHGAVSKEVVEKMLIGILRKTGSDMGIAISGILGPGGGHSEKPVGTVWIAAGDKDRVFTRKLQLRYDRIRNLYLTGNYALILLNEALCKMSLPAK